MVSAFIFFLHFIFVVFVFVIYRKESTGEGFLAIAFMGIVFAVSWTIATILTNLLFTPEWFVKWYWQPLDSWVWQVIRKEISRDTISLLILTGGEIAFYYYYFLVDTKKTEKKENPPSHSATST